MIKSDPIFKVKDKVAVITGGSGVLCSALAKALAERGARVVILGRNLEKIEAVVAQIRADGGEAIGISADVLEKKQLETARQTVLDCWGSIDILINGAGGNMSGAVVRPDQTFFEHLDFQSFEQVLALNLHGTVLPTQIFGAAMAAQKTGSIINISSMAAAQAVTRVVGYSAAKAAVDNFTKWLAVEVAQKFGASIRVNAIAPGFFVTEQNRALLTNPDGTFTERGAAVIRKTPAARFGEAEELAGACIWLCSDASRFVTGIILPVDGGFSAWSGV